MCSSFLTCILILTGNFIFRALGYLPPLFWASGFYSVPGSLLLPKEPHTNPVLKAATQLNTTIHPPAVQTVLSEALEVSSRLLCSAWRMVCRGKVWAPDRYNHLALSSFLSRRGGGPSKSALRSLPGLRAWTLVQSLICSKSYSESYFFEPG